MKRLAVAGLILIAAWSPVSAQTADEKKTTIAYLQSLQTPEGGFATARPPRDDKTPLKPSLRATSSALRALKYFGGAARDRAAAARFVAACYERESGGFVDQPGGKPDVTTTAIGVLAVVELNMPVQDYMNGVFRYLSKQVQSFDDIRIAAAAVEALGKEPTQALTWLEQVQRMQNRDGTYGAGDGKARDTGGAAVTVLRLGGKVKTDAVLTALRMGPRGDGGFGKEETPRSDLESTYRVMRAFHMLKGAPENVNLVRGFVNRCRNPDGGYSVTPGQPSSVAGTYYAAITLYWLSEKN
jgi:prenyltransferase beta subunit